MIEDGKFFGITAQIDLGNAMVGLATFCVAILSLFIALKSSDQASKRHIASLRQQWIDNLRIKVSEFNGFCWSATNASIDIVEANEKESYKAKISEINSSLQAMESYISLMLNDKERPHILVREIIAQCRGRVAVFSIKPTHILSDEIYALLNYLEDISKVILKQEWDKVKDEIIGRSNINIYARNYFRKKGTDVIVENVALKLSKLTNNSIKI